MDNISSYSGRRRASADQQRGETPNRTGTPLSRDDNRRVSLTRTADRIINAPNRLGSLPDSLTYHKRNLLRKARREDELFESSMTQKFENDPRISPKGWIPGVTRETPWMSEKSYDWVKKNDPETFSTISSGSDLGEAISIRLREEDYLSYKDSSKSGASRESHWTSMHPDNIGQPSRGSSSSTDNIKSAIEEMKDFDEGYESSLSRVIFRTSDTNTDS